jgi:uncharacterized membrane protein YoaT (DUF817 family)
VIKLQNHVGTEAETWGALRPFIALDQRARVWAEGSRVHTFIYEFGRFGFKQAWAALFGGLMLGLLIATHLYYPKQSWLLRYDFLVLASIAIQSAMLIFKLETWDEAKVIFIFHIVGTAMEIFKTAMGSWIYPEPSLLRIGGVPLFTGFMYAAVGSYIARAWRLFDFQFTRYPPFWATLALAIAIYINFFAHHYVTDMRLALFAAFAVLFGPTMIHYRIHHHWRRMPVIISTLLVSLFIWVAENVGTYTRAWAYPNQMDGWTLVPISKLGAWYLLMIISVVLVTIVQKPQIMAGSEGKRWPF